MKNRYNSLMFLAGSKKLKIALVLLTFVGLAFSLSCAFNHHSETSAHAPTTESVTILAQGSECCGTNLSKSDHSIKETFLTVPKNHARDLYDVLAIGLILVSVIIGRRLFEHIEQQLAFFVRLYTRQNLEISAFHYLRLAFSRGILNPKKYSVVFAS